MKQYFAKKGRRKALRTLSEKQDKELVMYQDFLKSIGAELDTTGLKRAISHGKRVLDRETATTSFLKGPDAILEGGEPQ